MVGLLLGLAVIAAVVAVVLKRARLRREERRRPGGSPASAIVVDRFDAIDAEARRQACRCGGRLRLVGEGSRSDGERRLRVVTCACDDCGRELRLHFDVTAAFH